MKMIMEIFGRFKKNQKVETPEVFDGNHPDFQNFVNVVEDARDNIVEKALKSDIRREEGLDPLRAQLIDMMMNMATYEDAADLRRDLKMVINMVRRLIKHLEGQEIRKPNDLMFTGMGSRDKNRDFTNQIFEPRRKAPVEDES